MAIHVFTLAFFSVHSDDNARMTEIIKSIQILFRNEKNRASSSSIPPIRSAFGGMFIL